MKGQLKECGKMSNDKIEMEHIESVGDFFLIYVGLGSENRFLTKPLLKKILRRLPPMMGMTAIRAPLVSEAKNNPGLEGYIPIDTSNITISTYTTGKPRVVACIHSCRE